MKEKKLTKKEKSVLNKANFAATKRKKVVSEVVKVTREVESNLKRLTQAEILDLNADEVIKMLEADFNYREIAKKFFVDLYAVSYFVNSSKHSARAREALQNSADIAFDKAEEAILDIQDEATQAAVARQRELAHHYRKKAAIKNKNKFSENFKIQAEVKDTSSTRAWLEETLATIDKNK